MRPVGFRLSTELAVLVTVGRQSRHNHWHFKKKKLCALKEKNTSKLFGLTCTLNNDMESNNC